MKLAAAPTVLAATLLFYAIASRGAEVVETEVTNAQGRYAVRFDVRLEAPPDRLKFYLTDYANYADYFDSIKMSEVLGRTPEGALRVRFELYSCVLFYCRTVRIVKDVTEEADGAIVARIDPTVSDFHEATEQWRIVSGADETRLQYQAELVPAFFVPPVIGPWLLRYRIRETLKDSAVKLEALAREER